MKQTYSTTHHEIYRWSLLNLCRSSVRSHSPTRKRYKHIRGRASVAGSPSVMEAPVVQTMALGVIRAAGSSFESIAFVRTSLHTPALTVERM